MDWEQRVADLWASIDACSEEEFLARMEHLVAELPVDDAVATFERASSLDSTGRSDLAVLLYRQALERGFRRALSARRDPAGELAAQPRSGAGERPPVDRRAQARFRRPRRRGERFSGASAGRHGTRARRGRRGAHRAVSPHDALSPLADQPRATAFRAGERLSGLPASREAARAAKRQPWTARESGGACARSFMP